MSNFYTGKTVMEAINDISTSNDTPKEIKITSPEGYEIDKENSTFECIKFKPVSKRFRDGYKEVHGYILVASRIKPFDSDVTANNHSVFYNYKYARSAKAMAIISQIMANDERFGGVVTDEEFENESIWIYSINRNKNMIQMYQGTRGVDHFLSFHTLEQRDLFLKENEDLVKEYLMID